MTTHIKRAKPNRPVAFLIDLSVLPASRFEFGQVFDVGHIGEHFRVPAECFLQCGQFVAKFLATGCVVERAGKRCFVPFGREGPDNLIEYDNRDLGKFVAVPPLLLKRLTR
jgi:hypothetical protein